MDRLISSIRLTGLAVIVAGCAVQAPPKPVTTLTLGRTLAVLKADGFEWGETVTADKGRCRSDFGCVEGATLTSFRKTGPARPVWIETRATALDTKGVAGMRSAGNVLMVFQTDVMSRPSYEDESAAVESVRKAFEKAQR